MMAEKPELEPYEVDLDKYDRVIFGFPVWASTYVPPLRTFITDQAEALKGKRVVAFACQTANGAEKAFEKLAKSLGIGNFETTAVFLDPKLKPSNETDVQIAEFAEKLATEA